MGTHPLDSASPKRIDRSGKLVYARAAAFDLQSLNAIVIPLLKEPVPEVPAAGAATAPAADPKTGGD